MIDATAPFAKDDRVVVEQREIFDVADIGCTHHLGDEVIEAVQIQVGEKLARQIADRQTAAALVGCEQVSPG